MSECNPKFAEIPTVDLLDELCARTRAFAMVYDMPANGDEESVAIRFSANAFYEAYGLMEALRSSMKDTMYNMVNGEDEEDEEEEEEVY